MPVKGMSLAVACNWLWNFGIGYTTPYLVNPTTTGPDRITTANLSVKVFSIWSSTCPGCFMFTSVSCLFFLLLFIGFCFIFYRCFFIPETTILTLEQIVLLYRESSGNVLFLFLFFCLYLLYASFLTFFLFCFIITVIGWEARRIKMVEQNETFTTNLQSCESRTFLSLPDPNLLFHLGKTFLISSRIRSTTMKKVTMYKRTDTDVLSPGTLVEFLTKIKTYFVFSVHSWYIYYSSLFHSWQSRWVWIFLYGGKRNCLVVVITLWIRTYFLCFRNGRASTLSCWPLFFGNPEKNFICYKGS